MVSNIQELTSLMFSMGRSMRDRMQKYLRGTGCPSLLHLEALRYIKEKGKPLMRDLAKSFSITPPAATLLVDSMVKDRLIKRIVDVKDRRIVRVALTPHGKSIIERGMEHRTDVMKEIFSALTQEERSQLITILKKLITTN